MGRSRSTTAFLFDVGYTLLDNDWAIADLQCQLERGVGANARCITGTSLSGVASALVVGIAVDHRPPCLLLVDDGAINQVLVRLG